MFPFRRKKESFYVVGGRRIEEERTYSLRPLIQTLLILLRFAYTLRMAFIFGWGIEGRGTVYAVEPAVTF